MPLIEMKGIVKEYPNVVANDNVDLTLNSSEILCVVGENGAGKSTLMNVLYGLEEPTKGKIFVDGKEVRFSNSTDAMKYGIGMVHQHFMLMGHLTVLENVILGQEPRKGLSIDFDKARKIVDDLQDELGFKLDLDKLVTDYPVGLRQQIEILKCLYRNANIIILDEPTAVLTPQETQELFVNLDKLVKNNRSIIMITHKLHEVMQVADRVMVMRNGKVVSEQDIEDASISKITVDMIGRELPTMLDRDPFLKKTVAVDVERINMRDLNGIQILDDVSFKINRGEILGVAAISGNGQSELEAVLAGLIPMDSGVIKLNGEDVSSYDRKERLRKGVSYIPEDRSVDGLCLTWNIMENLIGGYEDSDRFSKGFLKILNTQAIEDNANRAIEVFDIRPNNPNILTSQMSGGNQQKVVIARETATKSSFIVACEPTRGVDIGAISFIKDELIKLRNEGVAIIYFSSDLDELLSISDTLAVLYQGRIVSNKPTTEYTRQEIGYLMATGVNHEKLN